MNDATTAQALLQQIAKAPALVFLIVAAADGNIDKKEIKQFQKIIQSAEYAPLFAAMQQANMTIAELLHATQNSSLSIEEDFLLIREIIDSQMPEEVANSYKVLLLKLGTSIAEASGGFLGFFGSKIDKEEKLAIASIASILGLLDNDTPKAASVQKNPVHAADAQYNAESDIPDDLFPTLKPADWAVDARETTVIQDLLGGNSDDPVIGYAIDSPQMLMFLNKDQVSDSLRLNAIHEKALLNLEKRLENCSWQALELEIGEASANNAEGLILAGDYFASEAILSEKYLKQAHEKLDSALLMVIAPVRGELYVGKLMSEENPEIDRVFFAANAIEQHFNPTKAVISPNAWIARNGKVVGHVAGLEDIIEMAKRSAERKLAADEAKLTHSAITVESGTELDLNINVVAHDVEIMIENLQFVLRDYLQQIIGKDGFSGKIVANIDLADTDFNTEMTEELNHQMDGMFAFLNEQFQSLGFKSTQGESIQLSYQWT